MDRHIPLRSRPPTPLRAWHRYTFSPPLPNYAPQPQSPVRLPPSDHIEHTFGIEHLALLRPPFADLAAAVPHFPLRDFHPTDNVPLAPWKGEVLEHVEESQYWRTSARAGWAVRGYSDGGCIDELCETDCGFVRSGLPATARQRLEGQARQELRREFHGAVFDWGAFFVSLPHYTFKGRGSTLEVGLKMLTHYKNPPPPMPNRMPARPLPRQNRLPASSQRPQIRDRLPRPPHLRAQTRIRPFAHVGERNRALPHLASSDLRQQPVLLLLGRRQRLGLDAVLPCSRAR